MFAHGMLSMAYLGTLLTEHLPQSALRAWTVRFSARTPVHAQVTCRGVVRDVSGPVGQRRVTLDVTCELADGTVTLQGTAEFSAVFSTDPSVLDATSTGAGL